ncbi:hypothetical protein C7K25_15740 [Gulosibacter molinativorax]|uniref:Uncharacterized protein n=1 Tax=Gulosibacter molinativorax TaxID=256821 RepID=A0ABT7CC45_9MICO|nr:hypothetical protein [Gulosibacter molinativorax]
MELFSSFATRLLVLASISRELTQVGREIVLFEEAVRAMAFKHPGPPPLLGPLSMRVDFF